MPKDKNKGPKPVKIKRKKGSGQAGYGVQERLLQAHESNRDELNFARVRLHKYIRLSKNKKFEFSDLLFPEGTADILLNELAGCGWGYRLVEAEASSDYYEIYPLQQAEHDDIGD
jgi:hypothetical protein